LAVADGAYPATALIQGRDGTLYGVARSGGSHNLGSVFSITPAGTFTNLYSFGSNPADGKNPMSALVLGLDGNFYGTTEGGGTSDTGTIFKITPSKALTTLTSSVNTPTASLMLASDGNFYGTDNRGGASSKGSIYQVTPAGVVTVLASLNGTDGSAPQGLVQHTDGTFYGL